jgi:microcystin-dependent protein
MPYNVAPNPNDPDVAVGLPIGSLVLWAASTAPPGYLFCDGTAVSRSTYAHLFSIISTIFGVGNGTTTFNVPDTRLRMVRGSSPSASPPGTTGGADSNTLTGTVTIAAANLPQHRHGTLRGGGINIISSGSTAVQGTDENVGAPATTAGQTYLEDGTTVTANTALSLSVFGSTVPGYIAINYIIKFG